MELSCNKEEFPKWFEMNYKVVTSQDEDILKNAYIR